MSLRNIEHLVILMLENRSFDHALGYLSLPTSKGGAGRSDVDGLTGSEYETYRGRRYKVDELPDTTFDEDPGHNWEDVEEQLTTGFVRNFARHRKDRRKPLKSVMGYHTAAHLPAFDFLAEHYGVCDRWFSSVPGPTHPNRIYAMCGHSNGQKNNSIFRLPLNLLTIFDKLETDWACFYHDIPTLWFFENYILRHGPRFRRMQDFYRRAADCDLPKVTWIDPHFGKLPLGRRGEKRQNDDHPPTDTRRGQDLVRNVYNALVTADAWDRTLLVITYDEHGGFFDHVTPPATADAHPEFRRLGVRVPTLVASAWTDRRSADHTLYDHTSLIRTILNRFLPDVDPGLFKDRVAAANDLERSVNLPSPRTDRPVITPPAPYVTKYFPGTTFAPETISGLVEGEDEVDEAISWEECLEALTLMALAASEPTEGLPEEL